MMSVGADTTLLQLQQEVVDRVNLPVLIPAMNTERLLTPQQNSDLCIEGIAEMLLFEILEDREKVRKV